MSKACFFTATGEYNCNSASSIKANPHETTDVIIERFSVNETAGGFCNAAIVNQRCPGAQNVFCRKCSHKVNQKPAYECRPLNAPQCRT